MYCTIKKMRIWIWIETISCSKERTGCYNSESLIFRIRLIARLSFQRMQISIIKMLLWFGCTFRITVPLWGESFRHELIPLQKESVIQSLDIFCSVILNKHWTVELPVISDAMKLMWHHYNVFCVSGITLHYLAVYKQCNQIPSQTAIMYRACLCIQNSHSPVSWLIIPLVLQEAYEPFPPRKINAHNVKWHEIGLSQWEKTLHMWYPLSLAEIIFALPKTKKMDRSLYRTSYWSAFLRSHTVICQCIDNNSCLAGDDTQESVKFYRLVR